MIEAIKREVEKLISESVNKEIEDRVCKAGGVKQ